MGGGLSSAAADFVRGIAFDQNGKIYVTGTFSTAGGRPAKNIAAWNGSTWENVDIYPSTGGYDVAINRDNNNLFFSTAGEGNSKVSGITQINNIGSAEVAPKVYIKGSGKLVWLENQTTQQRISLDLDIQANEEVFIDFALGQINSTTRGRLLYTLYPGSDFQAFKLAPGVNQIASLCYNDVNASMFLYYTPQHWSVDATNRASNV